MSSARRSGLIPSTTRPGRLPIRKQIAESWNGGILPDAAVNSASSDHIRMAEKPISVALNVIVVPSRDFSHGNLRR
ncbi:hypothetical protein D9M72_614170 [compost metagenome]